MDIVQSMFDGVSYALSLNRSTLSGAIDIVVIRQPDGTFKSTPFHARFGKLHLLYSTEKIVNIEINGQEVPISMKLGNAGEAFFVEAATKEIGEVDPYLSTSPITKRKSNVPILESAPIIENQKLLESKSKSNLHEGNNQDDNRRRWKLTWMWGSLPRMQPNNDLLSTSTPSVEVPDIDINLRSSKSHDAFVSASMDLTNPQDFVSTSMDLTNVQDSLFHSCSELLTPTSPLEIRKESELASYSENVPEEEETVFFDFEEEEEPNQNSQAVAALDGAFSPPRTGEYGLEDGGMDIPGWDSRRNEIGSPEASKSLDESFTTIYKPDSQPSDDNVSSSPTFSNQDSLKSNSIESLSFLKFLNKDLILSDSIAISSCASQIFGPYNLPEPKKQQIFEQHLITHAQLSEQPNILSKTEDLVLKINSVFVPWNLGYPALMSALLFNKPLDKQTLEKLGKAEDKRQNTTKAWMSWLYPNRWKNASMPAPGALPPFAVQPQSSQNPLPPANPLPPSPATMAKLNSPTNPLNQSIDSAEELLLNVANGRAELSKSTPKNMGKMAPKKPAYFRKSLRPNSKQIELMGLQSGANSITFSVNTEFRGKQTLAATVYLWDWDSKLVISDIDGTITRSDIFGHVLPMLGKDWSHSGVAKLLSSIRENGYHIVYLTSRAIGQAQTTRNFINTLKQDGNTYLPKGPVFMSPDRLFCAFNREVILRKPEEFKIACLNDIKSLFPEGVHPFYAGYGNRNTDSVAYKAVGVSDGKVFIINPRGEITNNNKTYKKTYHNLHDLVHEMFPHTTDYRKGVSEDYNDWNYWKIPIPDLDDLN